MRVLSGLDWCDCECSGVDGGLGGGLGGTGGVRKPLFIQCVSQYNASPVGYITRPVINNAGNQLSESCVPTTMETNNGGHTCYDHPQTIHSLSYFRGVQIKI